ncbi:MAG: nitroreductase family protein, partial [Acidimicrobiia bacterium]
MAGAAAEPAVATAPVSFVLTGIPWRTGWKYGERGWRHLYWDAGTLLANLLATAAAHGLPARVLVGFVDAEVAHLVGVDGVEEFPLAIVAVGQDEPASVPEKPAPLRAAAAPLSPHPLVFPLVTEAQIGGALPDAPAVAAWRSGASKVGEPARVHRGGRPPPGLNPADAAGVRAPRGAHLGNVRGDKAGPLRFHAGRADHSPTNKPSPR